MRGTAHRIGSAVAALALGVAVAVTPAAGADPSVALPPMTSSGGGPIIGGGSNAGIAQQLFSFGTPNVQEVDGTDAAQFVTAAAASANPQLAAPFSLMRRALGCQTNNAGFGARAYRRSDGQWGGAMVVAAKSATPNVDALAGCAKTNWRRATAGTQTFALQHRLEHPQQLTRAAAARPTTSCSPAPPTTSAARSTGSSRTTPTGGRSSGARKRLRACPVGRPHALPMLRRQRRRGAISISVAPSPPQLR